MSFVVTLASFRPIPRFDGIPWTIANVQEAAGSTGPWLTIETFDPLAPVEPDATAPIARNFTTDQAVLEEGWYRVVWEDVNGNTEISDPVARRRVGPVSVAEVRANSPLVKQFFPTDPYNADEEARLENAVATSAALIEELTGRDLDDEGLSPNLRALAVRAVVLKTEQMAVRTRAKTSKGAVTSLSLRSFTAGPYSESYFGPGEAAAAKVLDPNPELHQLLWALATQEMRDYWIGLWTGEYPAAAGVQAFDYGARGRAREQRSAIRLGLRGPRF